MTQFSSATLTTGVSILFASLAHADAPVLQDLPKYQTPIPESASRIWHITQNLGPTGARGWVYGPDGHSRDSREILIKSIETGSPADGVLQRYDIIIGAAVPPNTPATTWRTAPAVKKFASDARLEFARAITWAESDQGKGQLRLLCVRDGVTKQVGIKIPVLGNYSKTAPFDCPKSSQIANNAADFLAENMPASGYSPGIGRPLNAMLLLASENASYLDHVRRSACRMSLNHTVTDAGHETWRWGNTNLFLCEYYLATGDKRVLPTIEEFCRVLAEGQCNPGTWGHRGVPDFIPPGYGSLNSSGVVCFLSLILGNQCGVKVDPQALRNSINFYGSYAGRGGIPYGDHPPTSDPSSNGKNGMAAVAFQMLGAEPAAQWFARMACSTNLRSFEGGHTGNFFNQTWTPLGASLTGRKNYASFWSRFNSYRDLARRWDGSFMTQPWPQKREGDLGTGNYVNKGPFWSTGGFALSYLADTKRLGVLGRTDSVFAKNAPAELKEALDYFHAKKFNFSSKAAAKLVNSADPRVQRLARQLETIAKNNHTSIRLTLADMEKNLAAGDLYKLKCQLQAIESIVDPKDTRLENFRAVVDDPINATVLAEGAQYHRAIKEISYAGPKGFQAITSPGSLKNKRTQRDLSTLMKRGKSNYKEMAKAHVESLPREPASANTSLIPQEKNKSSTWLVLPAGKKADSRWKESSFSARDWESVELPAKTITGKRMLRTGFEIEDVSAVESLELTYTTAGTMHIYLNGSLIMHLDPEGGKSKYDQATIPLKPSTRKLLKPGKNALAIEVSHPKGGDAFNLILKAAQKAN